MLILPVVICREQLSSTIRRYTGRTFHECEQRKVRTSKKASGKSNHVEAHTFHPSRTHVANLKNAHNGARECKLHQLKTSDLAAEPLDKHFVHSMALATRVSLSDLPSPLHRKMQLRCLNTLQTSVHKSASADQLRPCQRAYLGESNARRLLRRAQLTKKPGPSEIEDPIFVMHQEAAAQAATIAAVTPFDAAGRPSGAGATGYFVECYATHVEDERKRKDALATEKEKMVLFHSINMSRQVEGVHPLRLKTVLCKLAQDQADILAHDDLYPPPTRPGSNSASATANQNSVTVVMSPSGRRVARLVSPPHMGALACGEMWYGGKYRRHLYSIDPESPGGHPDNCPCHLRMVFETMVDEGWDGVGIGRGLDGRWVVELME